MKPCNVWPAARSSADSSSLDARTRRRCRRHRRRPLFRPVHSSRFLLARSPRALRPPLPGHARSRSSAACRPISISEPVRSRPGCMCNSIGSPLATIASHRRPTVQRTAGSRISPGSPLERCEPSCASVRPRPAAAGRNNKQSSRVLKQSNSSINSGRASFQASIFRRRRPRCPWHRQGRPRCRGRSVLWRLNAWKPWALPAARYCCCVARSRWAESLRVCVCNALRKAAARDRAVKEKCHAPHQPARFSPDHFGLRKIPGSFRPGGTGGSARRCRAARPHRSARAAWACWPRRTSGGGRTARSRRTARGARRAWASGPGGTGRSQRRSRRCWSRRTAWASRASRRDCTCCEHWVARLRRYRRKLCMLGGRNPCLRDLQGRRRAARPGERFSALLRSGGDRRTLHAKAVASAITSAVEIEMHSIPENLDRRISKKKNPPEAGIARAESGMPAR